MYSIGNYRVELESDDCAGVYQDQRFVGLYESFDRAVHVCFESYHGRMSETRAKYLAINDPAPTGWRRVTA